MSSLFNFFSCQPERDPIGNYFPNLSGPFPPALFFASETNDYELPMRKSLLLPSSFFCSSRCFSLNALSSSSISLSSFLGCFLNRKTLTFTEKTIDETNDLQWF